MATIEVEWEPLTEDEIRPQVLAKRTLRAIEYDARGQSIMACPECFHWEAQVDVVGDSIIIREWHKPDCTIAEEIRQACARCHDTVRKGYYCPECGLYSAEEPDEEPKG